METINARRTKFFMLFANKTTGRLLIPNAIGTNANKVRHSESNNHTETAMNLFSEVNVISKPVFINLKYQACIKKLASLFLNAGKMLRVLARNKDNFSLQNG